MLIAQKIGVMLALLSLIFAPTRPHQPDSQNPELQLRILLEKDAYTLNEPIFTRTEFTNLTHRTLCFAEPVQGIHDSAQGYLITNAVPPSRQGEILFVIMGGHWPTHEQLRSDIANVWIKLAPNAVYVSRRAPVRFKLNTEGDWELQASYYPTERTFGSAQGREELLDLARETGCNPPESVANSPSTKIQVVMSNK